MTVNWNALSERELRDIVRVYGQNNSCPIVLAQNSASMEIHMAAMAKKELIRREKLREYARG